MNVKGLIPCIVPLTSRPALPAKIVKIAGVLDGLKGRALALNARESSAMTPVVVKSFQVFKVPHTPTYIVGVKMTHTTLWEIPGGSLSNSYSYSCSSLLARIRKITGLPIPQSNVIRRINTATAIESHPDSDLVMRGPGKTAREFDLMFFVNIV